MDDLTTLRTETHVAPDVFTAGHVSGAYRPGGHVADTRLFHNDACAARLEQTRMAGAFGEPFPKGSC
jgi:hypothetical protein